MKFITMAPGGPPMIFDDNGEGEILDTLQHAVGGYICTALRIESPVYGRTIDCYCHDEGLLLRLPFNFFRPTDRSPIVGPVIFSATDARGETVSLTDEEVVVVTDLVNRLVRA